MLTTQESARSQLGQMVAPNQYFSRGIQQEIEEEHEIELPDAVASQASPNVKEVQAGYSINIESEAEKASFNISQLSAVIQDRRFRQPAPA